MPDLRRRLADHSGLPLVLDAAIGTRLLASGLDLGRDDPCLWVLDQPEAVFELHASDVRAGADAITTDTFGANPTWLARFGRGDEATGINQAAVRMAREAGPDLFVLGSIGPTAGDADAFRDQALALAAAGADGLLVETQTLSTALACLAAIRIRVSIPILISLFDWSDGAEARLVEAGADAIGINCVDPMRASEWVGGRAESRKLPILVRPSAARPGGGDIEPIAFAERLMTLVGKRPEVRLVGGCCGATDRHVAAIRRVLDLGSPPKV